MPSGFQAFGSAEGYVGSPSGFAPIQLHPVWAYDAAIGVTGTATVSSWADQSGNAHTATNSGAGRPSLNASNSVFNNLPSIHFAAAPQCLLTGAFSVPATGTLFLVGSIADTFGINWFDGIAFNSYQFYIPSADHIEWLKSTQVTGATTISVNTAYLWCIEDNGASSKIYKNSLTSLVTGDPGTDTPGGVSIGAFSDGSGCLRGDIAEFYLFPLLSGANRNTMINYLALKYAITLV